MKRMIDNKSTGLPEINAEGEISGQSLEDLIFTGLTNLGDKLQEANCGSHPAAEDT